MELKDNHKECKACRTYRQLSKKNKAMRIEAMAMFGIKREDNDS